MKRIDIQPLIAGGGGYRSLNQQVVVARLNSYAQRKWKCQVSTVNPHRRAMCVYVLRVGFEYQQQQIADILSISQPVVSTDFKLAQFYVNQFANYRNEVRKIYDYILYNARYLP